MLEVVSYGAAERQGDAAFYQFANRQFHGSDSREHGADKDLPSDRQHVLPGATPACD
jgi:hypothetical protein